MCIVTLIFSYRSRERRITVFCCYLKASFIEYTQKYLELCNPEYFCNASFPVALSVILNEKNSCSFDQNPEKSDPDFEFDLFVETSLPVNRFRRHTFSLSYL